MRAGDFETNFSFETELPVTLILSEFCFFQCICNRKLRGLARPLNVIQSSYNFAGFISISKRNFILNGQLYLRTFNFWDTVLNVLHSIYSDSQRSQWSVLAVIASSSQCFCSNASCKPASCTFHSTAPIIMYRLTFFIAMLMLFEHYNEEMVAVQ